MSGETSLAVLLSSMSPVLHEGEYVFCTVDAGHDPDLKEVLCFFREAEGLTLIMRKSLADAKGLVYTFVASWITLTVHSSLAAVGLTAAVANALAGQHISCNVVAAFYHDHIFVPEQDAEKAMLALQALSATA
jgi:hypothetical protein